MSMANKIGVQMVLMPEAEYERMKNCVNCDHHEVCLEVARRKATKANDYSACSHWKMVESDE